MSLTFHIVGDAFVDFFCYLSGDWPERGGDSFLDTPVKAYAGGSSTNTATHLKSLISQGKQLQEDSHNSSSSRVNQEEDEEESTTTTVILQTVLNPNDHYGKILLEHTDRHGLNLVNCFRNNNDSNNIDSISQEQQASTGHCVAIVSRGERSFMTHRGCVDVFTAQHLDIQRMIEADAESLHIHVAGYFNMTGFWHGKLKRELDRIRCERNKRRIQDHHHSTLSSGRQQHRSRCSTTTISLVTQHDATDEWDGGMDELVPDIDFFIMNELEANKILRRSRSKNSSNNTNQTSTTNHNKNQNQSNSDHPHVNVIDDDHDDHVDVIREWVNHFSSLSPTTHFIVTRGANGAVAFRNFERIATLHPAIPVQVVDPTGAGDSFTAGFLHGIWSYKRKQQEEETNEKKNTGGSSSSHCVEEEEEEEDNPQQEQQQSLSWSPEAIKQGLLWGCAVGTAAVTIRGASVPSEAETILDLYQRQKAKETLYTKNNHPNNGC